MIVLPVQTGLLLIFALYGMVGVLQTVAFLAAPLVILAIVTQPVFGLVMVIFSTALDAYGVLPFFGELRISLFHIILLSTIAGWVGKKMLSGRLSVCNSRIYLVLGGYFSMFLVSMVYSPAPDTALFIVVRALFLILMAFLIVDLIDTKKKMMILLCALFGGAFFVAILAISQSFAGLGAGIGNLFLGRLARSKATFGDPNVMGAFLMGAIIVATSLLVNMRQKLLSLILLAAVLLVLCGGIMTTFSRSAWLSTGVGILVVLGARKNLKVLLAALISLGVVVFILTRFLPFGGLIFGRMATLVSQGTGDVSIRIRAYMSVSGIKMFLGHPIFGVGLGGFAALYPKYIQPQLTATMGLVRLSHVMPITVLAECGIVGMTIFLWFVFRVVREGLSAIRAAKDSLLRATTIGLVIAFLTYMVDFLFYSNFFDNLFWIIIGLIFAATRIRPAAGGDFPMGNRRTMVDFG
jgi:O-antigen ligase